MNCLTLILGPMFAGKSTELINIYTKLSAANKRVLVVKHAFDTRYDDEALTTHTDSRIFARRSMLLADFIDEFTNYDALIVDEGQFFVDIVSTVKIALKKGLYVYISALSGNFKREPFEVIPQLFPLASSIYLRSAICAICHAPAPFSARFSAQTEEIVIGGAELYAPTCRSCWQTISCQRAITQAHQLTDEEIHNIISRTASIAESTDNLAFTEGRMLLVPLVSTPFDTELCNIYTSFANAGKHLLMITQSKSQELDKAAQTFGFALMRFDSLTDAGNECTLAESIKKAVAEESIVLFYHADLYPDAVKILDGLVFEGKTVIALTSKSISYQYLGSLLSHADLVSFSSLTRGTPQDSKMNEGPEATDKHPAKGLPLFFKTCFTGLALEQLNLGICSKL